MAHKKAGLDVAMQEKRDRALELRRIGLSVRAIAAKMGISRSRAHELVQEGLAGIPRENAEGLRKLHQERLDAMLVALCEEPKYSDKGKLLSGGAMHGEPSAMSAAVKVLERMARLGGLDAPTRTQLDVGKPLEKWTEAELRAELARLGEGGKAA